MSSNPKIESASEAPDTDTDQGQQHLPVWLESIVLLGVALVLAVIIKTLFVQAFYIPSESMEPGLIRNDRILVQKPSYWFSNPSRGDVVVFKDPGGWLSVRDNTGPTNLVAKAMAKIGLYPTGGHLVKRVIGVEGDTIECCDDQGRILVNGQPLDESDYARPSDHACGGSGRGSCYGPMPGTKTWSVGPIPAGKLFVMGDNRADSADSSAHMCVRNRGNCTKSPWVGTNLVVGKVMALVWPLGRFDWVTRPDTFESIPDAG